MTLKLKLEALLKNNDWASWLVFLDTCTMQEAVYAHMLASQAGRDDLRMLAFKRTQHLNGEHRHIDLWR